jgi:hypothetical protein
MYGLAEVEATVKCEIVETVKDGGVKPQGQLFILEKEHVPHSPYHGSIRDHNSDLASLGAVTCNWNSLTLFAFVPHCLILSPHFL